MAPGPMMLLSETTMGDSKRDMRLYLSESSIATIREEAFRAQLSPSAFVRVIMRLWHEERYQEDLRKRVLEIILEESRRV